MVYYNRENRITMEELSPSLQNLINYAAKKEEVSNLINRTNALTVLLSNSRFWVVDSLEDILQPVNAKDVAVCGKGTDYKLYFYYNNTWNRIPISTVDLNTEYTIIIHQSPNQTIVAEYNGVYYRSSFKAKVNSNIKMVVTPNSGYIAGELNCPNEFTVVEDINIYVTAATKIPKYKITVTPSAHQKIEIMYNNRLYTNTSISNVLEKDTYTINTTVDDGYIAGQLNVSDGSIFLYSSVYMLLGDTTVSLTPVSRKIYNVSIPATENQVIHFTYINSDTGQTITEDVTTLNKTFNVPYGSVYTVTADGRNGYLPGTLSTTAGNVVSDMTITISAARPTYNKEILDNPMTYTWTAPNYISKVHVQVLGAGGGAHQEVIEVQSASIGYFDGGNGELIDSIIPVIAGTRYSIKVGKAGTTFESDGEPSIAFGITANGGSVTGEDAGNGQGGRGDIINHLTGEMIKRADNGTVILEYGTNIEKEEVTG